MKDAYQVKPFRPEESLEERRKQVRNLSEFVQAQDCLMHVQRSARLTQDKSDHVIKTNDYHMSQCNSKKQIINAKDEQRKEA